MLHENGISISYDRVLVDGVVCPPILRKGLFTTSAMDNIDHNPTATVSGTKNVKKGNRHHE